jgi:hypothetical protein
MSPRTHRAESGRFARPRDWTRPAKALAAVILAIAIGATPAVALAKFSSSPTATITISSGPLPPTGVTISCPGTKTKLIITWTAPSPQPTSYTLWVSLGKEYSQVETTVTGSQTSAEIGSGSFTYTVELKALYGSWTSGFSAPSNSVKC